ncbi:uncharacterized protein [Dermacentor andersoni]|uniref:uncharacterized protein n=1 Tax=Dermacentor andersoni TaxID=34620 RepID=UPI002416EC0D|nr:uncharacterized protein LOC126523016 [Dermacentor andersoni]
MAAALAPQDLTEDSICSNKRSFCTYPQATECEALQSVRKKAILLSNLGFEGRRLYYDLASRTDLTTAAFEDILRLFGRHYLQGQEATTQGNLSGLRHRVTKASACLCVRRLASPFATKSCKASHQQENEKDYSTEDPPSRSRKPRKLDEAWSKSTKNFVFNSSVQRVSTQHQDGVDSHHLPRLSAQDGGPCHPSSTRQLPNGAQRHGGKSQRGEADQHGAWPELCEASRDIAVHCYRCGSPHHIASDPGRPAKHVTCRACGKVGHYASVCRSTSRTQRQSPARTQLVSTTADTESVTTGPSVLTIQAPNSRPAIIDAEVLIPNTTLNLLVDTYGVADEQFPARRTFQCF